MYFARPVVPLVVANISGSSAGEHVLLAGEDAVDVRRQRLVGVHRHGCAVVLDRLDPAEAVVASEGRVLVAADDLEQLLLLRLARRPGGVVELFAALNFSHVRSSRCKAGVPLMDARPPRPRAPARRCRISSTSSSRTWTPRPRPPKTRARPRRPGSTRSSVRSRFSSRLPPEPSSSAAPIAAAAWRPAAERIPLSPTCAPTTQKIPASSAIRAIRIESRSPPHFETRMLNAPHAFVSASRARLLDGAQRLVARSAGTETASRPAAARRRRRRRPAARRRRSRRRPCARSPRRPRRASRRSSRPPAGRRRGRAPCAAARASEDRARGRRRP